MSIGDDFVERGYFPRELPPCFTTTLLAQYVNIMGMSAVNLVHAGGSWTRPARHNLARPAGMRRVLSVPNPLNFLRLAEALDSAWVPLIEPLLATATLATSRPVCSLGPRTLAPMFGSTLAERRALARSGHRYILKADIQNFYPSIYTHSVPWVLHGKAAAKAQQKVASLAGNRIDKAIREGQDGQTMGLPIGPDSSWALAECILARIEGQLRVKLPALVGDRYNDDFELAFASVAEAEAGMSVLQEILAEYELSLNPRKTSIVELPSRVEGDGVAELRGWNFRAGAKAQRTDIVDYFDRLADLIVADRGGNIASYAVARLRDVAFASTSWPLLEACLLQLLVAEPYCARQVAMTLSTLTNNGHSITKSALTDASERLIVRHAPLGHGSEVCWALWLSIAHSAPITQRAATVLGAMDDCFVALLALHAKTHSIIAGKLDTTQWEDQMTSDELRGTRWLLSYEARLKGWLPSKNSANHLLAEPFFQDLSTASVSFYDMNGFVLTFAPIQAPASSGGGGGGPYVI